ncbi:MAG: hypothetical protein L0287_11305 [Anaerolineae bacterium]|nr:hypothetical protein [Anaerolineae bacterium]
MNSTIHAKLGHLMVTQEAQISGLVGTRPGRKETYATQSIRLERPERDKTITQVICSVCGKPIEISVASGQTVQNSQLLYRIIAVILLLFSCGVYSGFVGGLRPGEITTFQACLGFLAFFSILGAVGLFALAAGGDATLALGIVTAPEGHALFYDYSG